VIWRRFAYLLVLSLLLLLLIVPKTSALTLDDSEVFILEAPTNTVYFVYSDTVKATKPLGVVRASPIDWTATGYIKGMTRYPQLEGLDTNGGLVDQSSGGPMFSDKSVVMSGGPIVQVLVEYYEANRIAPAYFGCQNGKDYLFQRDGTRIEASGLNPTAHEDIFVVEHFLDTKGNAVLIVYGYTGLGTFAGAQFFKSVIYPNIRDYTHSYYIYHWLDINNDGFPDLSEINPTPLASGD
jgi:hypothetical protein